MDSETSLYLENIDEYVNDEDRVVTYKWLSQTLEIHVNLAKRLLETYLQEQKKKRNAESLPLCVTYALTGTQETENGTQMTRVVIVNGDRLEEEKSGMKVVLGQHVFSIQKGSLKDNSALFAADYEIIKQNITQTNRFSAIQCDAAKVRSKEELERLRAAQQTSRLEKPQVNGLDSQRASSATSKPAEPLPAPKPKKGSIAASFASQKAKSAAKETKQEKKDAGMDEKKEEPKKKDDVRQKESLKTKPKGMMAFLSQTKSDKQSPPSRSSPGPVGDAKRVDDGQRGGEREEEGGKEGRPRRMDVEPSTTVRKGRQPEKTKKRADISDSDSDDERRHKTVVAKKRRRIIQQDDSSSDEEENEDEEDMDESPIPPTPPPKVRTGDSGDEPELAPLPPSRDESEQRPPSGAGSGRRRIRKRVLKSKVSVDDDGCMVTEKVWESESTDASEEDEPLPPTYPKTKAEMRDSDDDEKKGKKGRGKKTSPPSSGKGKQSSLMSFFKKK